MNIINQWPIQANYKLVEVENFSEDFYKSQLTDQLTSEYPFLKWQQTLEDEAKEKIKALAMLTLDSFKLKLAVLLDDEIVAFSYGWQESPTTFFMAASLVLPEHRFKGLYSSMVEKVLEITKARGFQSVSSFHITTNNPVIISKLKLGFTIAGLQVDAVHGILVKLVFHHNSLLHSAARFRAGAIGETVVRDMLVSAVNSTR